MSQPRRQGSADRTALVALGANVDSRLGAPAETLRAALHEIERALGPVTGKSRLWRTPAFPPGSGPDYVNAAAAVATALAPEAVLAALHRIEAEFGRIRAERWGARGIDLDLLALDDLVRPDAATQTLWRDLPAAEQRRSAPDGLILPHPRLQDRAFVLVPLAEVAPGWRHPLTGRTVAGMLSALPAEDIAALAPLS